MKKAWANFVKTFQPKYSVVVNMYHVVPGTPVKKHAHKHEFGKGELDEASIFFHKVVKKHSQLGFPNTEVQLIKGKKTVVQAKNYGPVELVKGLNVQSA
ncbi:MAG: hypothetical protein RIC30_00140 [Marinoscillum sp.]|uniref:hypothetical protein n=1 Tax=Marinoscillum sp. TaxID=2024838 RepID=UPI0032F86C9B